MLTLALIGDTYGCPARYNSFALVFVDVIDLIINPINTSPEHCDKFVRCDYVGGKIEITRHALLAARFGPMFIIHAITLWLEINGTVLFDKILSSNNLRSRFST
jgi:hypothetical protein